MMTRREMLAACAGAALLPSGDGYHEPSILESTQLCADWDVMALKHNRPKDWHLWHYITAVQWRPDALMLYAIGTPEYVRREFEHHRQGWRDEETGERWILAEYIRPDERAFAIAISGRMSDGLKEECRRNAPDYTETMPGQRRISKRWLTPVYSDEEFA